MYAAAIIQTVAAVVFLGSVGFDAYRRYRLSEQERRDHLIRHLSLIWSKDPTLSAGRTEEEAHGFYSQRQIDFFNAQLKARGERWTYDPLRRDHVLPSLKCQDRDCLPTVWRPIMLVTGNTRVTPQPKFPLAAVSSAKHCSMSAAERAVP